MVVLVQISFLLASIFNLFSGKQIFYIGLLEQNISHIFFIFEKLTDRLPTPATSACWRGYTLFIQPIRYCSEAVSYTHLVTAQGGVANGGRIYGRTSNIQEFVDEDYYRSIWSRWNPADVVDQLVAREDRNEAGQLSVNAQLFGMEPFALDQLTVLEGDLSKLHDPDGRYIAAVYGEDDYGNPEMGSHWARLGDTVTLRYVDEIEYYYTDTGEIIADFDQVDPDGARDFDSRVVSYRDVEYTVAALVSVPHAISYRYYGSDEFVLNAQTFIQRCV